MKHVVDKSRLAESLQKTSLALIMLEISVWLTPLTRQSEALRYVQQGTYLISAVLAVIAFISITKLLPSTLRRAIFDKFLFAIRKMASNISGISKKIFSFFGIRHERTRRTKDEKSFIFGEDDEEKRRKRHAVKASSRWRDAEENSEKIRFLYVKYIVKMVKGGYKYHAAFTPNEVRKDIGADEEQEENEIFDLYNGARYSGGSVFITDEQVERVMSTVNSKKKIKMQTD